jgi:hypothetical protein
MPLPKVFTFAHGASEFKFHEPLQGGGGMRLPLIQAGGLAPSAEWDKYAQITYASNFGIFLS